jgi:hypothetical protein
MIGYLVTRRAAIVYHVYTQHQLLAANIITSPKQAAHARVYAVFVAVSATAS